ncbi:MAG: pectinesterase family protein [Lachnospiraceae bacterium]
MKSKAMKRVISSVMVLLMTISLLPANMLGWEVQEVKAASLTLDGEEVSWDLRNSSFGAYSGEGSWTSSDGILTVTGSISYNGTQHGANVSTGNKFSINVPAGKTTITVSGCAYGSSSATLEVNSAVVVASQSLGQLPIDGQEVKFVYTSDSATTVDLVINGSGCIHYIKAKTETDAKLTLDAEAVTWDLRNADFGAYGNSGDSWTSNDKILKITGAISYYGAQHGADISTGNIFSIKVPAGTTTITALACAYGSGKAKLQVNGIDVVAEQPIGGLTEGGEVVFTYTSSVDTTVDLVITNGGFLHGIKAQTVTPALAATVTGAVGTSVNGEKLVFKKDGVAAAEATIADGEYTVELEVGSSYTVEFKKSALYEISSGGTIDLTEVSSGQTVTNNITYSALPTPRLTLDGEEVTWTFTSGIFGSTGTVEADTMSPDGIVTLNGVNMSWNSGGHGLVVKNGSEIAITVPAGQTTVTVTACQYAGGKASGNLFASLYISGTKVSDDVDLYDSVDKTERTLICETDAPATVVLKVEGSGSGYFHWLSAKAETVQPTATVSGTIGTAVNGQKLLFKKSGSTVAEATVADGTYSVALPVGSEYTVEFESSTMYKVVQGGTIDLTNTSAGTTVTNDITYAAWNATKTFDITIGGAKFEFTPGATEADAFTGSVTGTDTNAKVEIATDTAALIWANLGGAGSGTLTADKITAKSSNITTSVSGNEITVTYTDTSTNPSSYKILVRDNSATGIPAADGTPRSYSFTDGSVVSKLYAKGSAYKLTGGKSTTSTDKFITVTGNNSIIVNDATHGIAIKNNDTISVAVAGDATITFTTCKEGNAGNIVASGMASGATITPASVTSKPATDATDATFTYTGDATTLVFTFQNEGTNYLHKMSVTNKAQASEEHTQAAMPKVMDYGTKSSLTVTPVGQRIILAQTGGILQTNSGAVDPSVSYYAFDATKEAYHLEADVVLNTCGSTNTAGIFFGAFDGDNIMTVGIRNSTGLRGIYSKSSSDMAGAGIVDLAIENGQKVHFDVQKTDAGLVVTATPEGGTAQTAVFKYNDSSYLLLKDDGKNQNVSYGFIVSNATATIRNMKYSNAAGTVLYDQNKCYDPVGTAPVVSTVNATAASSRDYFTVDWVSSTPASGDGRYILEVSKDGGAWTTVSTELETTTYKYPITETGTYKFRVSGKLGVNGTPNTPVESAGKYILAALPPLEVTITSDATSITTSWNAIAAATSYDVYRYSFDEGAENAVKVATVTQATYKDTNVVAEMPYYYYVIGYSSTNNTNPSEVVWAVATPGHTGDYVYENEAAEIFITQKSYDTVFSGKATLEGIVDRAGTMKAMVNGAEQGTKTLAAKDTFSFELTLAEGRNDVNLLFTDANGKVTRKTYNFVYLTNYDYAVDASFTGNDGDANVDGKPTYKTVQAAVNAVSSGNTDTKVILVMNGSYEERLVVNAPNISIIGQDRELTSIHYYPGILGSAYEAGADMDKRCATYIQSGATGFSAENITFKNDYVYSTPDGKSNKSADAIRVEADGAMFVNVRMSSIQDTLYMHAGHQYYYKCLIEGVVDFIYSGDDARSFFNDCDIKFVYESTKTSGYVCAPRTKNTATYGLTFYNCTVTGEEGCSGTGYLLCRPWGPDAYVTWINCYMGKTINALTPYGDMSGNLATEARFFEYYSYGPGSAINEERRQISPTKAGQMLTDAYLEWTPKANSAEISANHYVGSLQSNLTDGSTTAVPNDDKYAWTDGDDTGLKAYDMEGYSAAFGVSGGGLLKEVNSNYYKVATAEEFLDALVNIKKTGKNSVIELTADINLGSKEIKNFDSYNSIITPYKAQALTHPTLIKSGVSVLNITDMHNLTIFSSNGSSIKHANITMKNSSNIIIRNIKFDELWEWDEDTSGAYDRNDWDYMTIDESTDGVWIDHCTFFKAYDGVVDIKNPAPTANVTISWCEFLPGSEDNIFFNEMMDLMSSNPSAYPYYKSLLDSGMTEDQIWWYAYGQKKTHLLGQSDTATNAAGIRVTLANNYYKNSMDRMPRLRYGASHVYNCIMDAQDLLNARNSISNESAAKHIVSNGASSTCGGSVLLENCYISGIENALNSGNGDSPAGYINAINSVYYMNGKATKLEPKVNNTIPGTTVLVTDADQFKASLPYSEYTLYDAENLKNIIVPYVGAGKMNFTVLQWEKTSYNAQEAAPEVPGTVFKAKVSEIPATVLTNEVKEATGCKTVKELIAYLRAMITDSVGAAAILSGVDPVNTSAVDVTIQISYDGGKTWENVTAQNFPKNGMDVIIPYPTGINPYNYDFVIGHLITMGCNGAKVGSMEYYNPQKVTDGLQIHINSASPFVIGWKEIPESDDEEDPIRSVATGDTTPIVPMAVMMFVSLTLCLTMAVSTRRSRKVTKK